MKCLAVLAVFIAAVLAADDQELQESKSIRSWKPQYAAFHRVPSYHAGRWARSVEEETDDQQVGEWNNRPYYARPYGGSSSVKRWRRSTDDQDTEENHRRPYYGSYYSPSYRRYARSVEDSEVQADDQQTDDLFYRRYGGYRGHYGGYYGGYGYRRPYWG